MGKEKTGDCSTTAGVVGQAIQENRWSEIETVKSERKEDWDKNKIRWK